MNPSLRRLAALCAASAALALPSAAAAQQQEGLSGGEQAFLVLSSSSTTSAGVTTVGYIFLGEREKALERDITILRQIVMVDDYIKANPAAVQMAFTLGAGDELDELVALLGHEDELTLEQRLELRARRDVLLSSAQGRDPRPLADAFRIYAVFADVLWDRQVVEVTR
jgi:hypothetical protein